MLNGNGQGCLYGVGVGPGDPELLTLKAVRIMRAVDVVFAPHAETSDDSLALTVVREFLDLERQQIVYAPFAMGIDTDEVWGQVADDILGHIRTGRSVAFLTLGDPMLYGSFMYVMEKVLNAEPNVPVEVVPGVSSISASAATARVAIVSHRERLAVLPSMYGVDDLRQVLAQFDTVVLMKVNQKAVKAVEEIERDGGLERCVFVRRATTEREMVVRSVSELKPDDMDYFSMLILSATRETRTA
ncbi:MAG: precorrin-2 C(20)-methyltransferase [Chloroflexi bacterium]|nr:precorrin-2 C(20)-methyltransferase [Chloroflexota bacterium]MDA1228095.1 precorrin-2 C(20)-methyltransferase [Chloroflexota bacterium]